MAPVRAKRPGTAREWAARFGVTPRTIYNTVALERADYEATAADRRRVAGTMHATGASWAEIAEAIKSTEWAARALVRRYKAECKASGRDAETGDLFTPRQP